MTDPELMFHFKSGHKLDDDETDEETEENSEESDFSEE